MDDIKQFKRNIDEINFIFQIVRIVTGDIRMEFVIQKCVLANIMKGKLISVGIQVPEDNNNRH